MRKTLQERLGFSSPVSTDFSSDDDQTRSPLKTAQFRVSVFLAFQITCYGAIPFSWFSSTEFRRNGDQTPELQLLTILLRRWLTPYATTSSFLASVLPMSRLFTMMLVDTLAPGSPQMDTFLGRGEGHFFLGRGGGGSKLVIQPGVSERAPMLLPPASQNPWLCCTLRGGGQTSGRSQLVGVNPGCIMGRCGHQCRTRQWTTFGSQRGLFILAQPAQKELTMLAFRWSTMLACTAARAFAASLLLDQKSIGSLSRQ